MLVLSVEHRDRTALHFKSEDNSDVLIKNVEMRSYQKINLQLSKRLKEFSAVLKNCSELVSQIKCFDPSCVEVGRKGDKVLAMGYGIGGVTAI